MLKKKILSVFIAGAFMLSGNCIYLPKASAEITSTVSVPEGHPV